MHSQRTIYIAIKKVNICFIFTLSNFESLNVKYLNIEY